jgi:hypothetical protein
MCYYKDFLKSLSKVQNLLGMSQSPHEAVKEQMIHEQIPQEKDLEVSSNPYQQEKTKSMSHGQSLMRSRY